MSDNHFQRIAVNPDVARQTPKNSFGDELAYAMKKAPEMGAALIGALAPGMPVLSAAVSGAESVVSGGIVAGGASASTNVDAGGIALPGGSGSGVPGGGGINDLLQQIGAGGSGSNEAYLKLQMYMQQESQQFTAVSNILKVRSDSAKAAINNIR